MGAISKEGGQDLSSGQSEPQLPQSKNLPVPAVAEPWLNLIHQIGMPWALLIGLCWFFYPIAVKSLDTLNKLDSHANRAMPMLEKATDAIPLLEQLNRQTSQAARQRHNDLTEIKANIPQKKDDLP